MRLELATSASVIIFVKVLLPLIIVSGETISIRVNEDMSRGLLMVSELARGT
jgi:hypothetical protein